MPKRLDLSGQTFGFIRVLEPTDRRLIPVVPHGGHDPPARLGWTYLRRMGPSGWEVPEGQEKGGGPVLMPPRPGGCEAERRGIRAIPLRSYCSAIIWLFRANFSVR